MAFISRYLGTCSFCGEELQGKRTSYAKDHTLVHTDTCLIPYNTDMDPISVAFHRGKDVECSS